MFSSLRKKKKNKATLLLRDNPLDAVSLTPPPPAIKRQAATEPRKRIADISNTPTKSLGGGDPNSPSLKKFFFCTKETAEREEEGKGDRRQGSENSTIPSTSSFNTSPPLSASPESAPRSPSPQVTRHLEVVFDNQTSASSRVVETTRRKQPKVDTGNNKYNQLTSPPKKSPRLDSMNHHSDMHKEAIMQTPSRVEHQRDQQSQNRWQQKPAQSPDSSSFNSFDFAMPENANDNYLSPSVAARSSNRRANAMKTPGLHIPTPHRHKNRMAFPHPLSNLQSSPMAHDQASFEQHISMNGGSVGSSIQENSTHNLNNRSVLGDDDDDAFLPNDFKATEEQQTNVMTAESPHSKMYSLQEVQNMILEAEQKIHSEWTERHEQELASFEADVEKSLLEQGQQWKKDAEEEYARLQRLVQREKQISTQSQEQLNQQAKQVFSLQSELDESRQKQQELAKSSAALRQIQQEKELAETKVQQLQQFISNVQKRQMIPKEENESIIPSESWHDEEVKALQDQKVTKDETLRLQSEKDLAERKLQQVTTQLADSRKGRAATQVQLRNAKAEIDSLQEKLMNSSTGMPSTILSEASTVINSTQMNEDLKESVRRLEQENSQLLQQQKVLQRQIAAATAAASASSEAIELANNKGNVTKLKKELSQVTKQRDAYEKYVKILREKQSEELEKAIAAEKQRLKKQYERDNSAAATFGDGATNATFGTEFSGETGFTTAFAGEELRLREEFDEHKVVLIKAHKQEIDSMTQHLSQLDELHINQVELAMLQLFGGIDNTDAIANLSEQVDLLIQSNQVPEGESNLPALTNVQKKLDEWKAKREEALQASNKEIINTQVVPLQQELASVQGKRDQLQSALSAAKTQLTEAEQATQAIETANKEILEAQLRPLQHELKSMENERDQLQLDLTIAQTVVKQADQATEATVETVNKEKKALAAKLKPLEQELESIQKDRDQLQHDLSESKAQVEQMTQAMEKLQEEQSEMKSSNEELNERLAVVVKLEEEKQAADSRVRELGLMMKDLEVSHSKQVEEAVRESQAKLGELQNQQKSALDTAASENQELESMWQDSQTKMADMEAKHTRDLEAAKLLQQSSGADESALEQKLAEIESKAEADRADYNRMVKGVRDEHTKEIEELIAQLDLVVAEHEEKYSDQGKILKEKDTVISALGSQLAEAQSRFNEISGSSAGLEAELETLKKDMVTLRLEAETSRQDVTLLMEDHKKEMKRQALLRKEACEEAREEMIQRAEVRYEEANQLFRNLKKRFDKANTRIIHLEQELKDAKIETEDIKRKQEVQERGLREDLARAKADVATSDANAVRIERQYKEDLEDALESRDSVRMQLEETKATSQQIQSTLAAVVAEKEKLMNEYTEMKAVCEELMAMVESSAASA